MYVEFRNITTGQFYYLCGAEEDPCAIIYNPNIRGAMIELDPELRIREVFDMIRPVVDRLTEGNTDKWEVNIFKFSNLPLNSLTQADLARSYGLWRVGEPTFVDGVKRPTVFVSI